MFKLTKTSLLAIIGLIASLMTINAHLLNVSPYIVTTSFSIGTLIVYNFYRSDDESKVTINVISVLFVIVGTAGYFLDNPIVHPDGTISYFIPITILAAIKESAVMILRFIQAKAAIANGTVRRAIRS